MPKSEQSYIETRAKGSIRMQKQYGQNLEMNYLIMKIFEKEIRMNRLLEKLKAGLVCKPDFDYYDAFSFIDSNNQGNFFAPKTNPGSIDPDTMQSFIKKHKTNVTEDEILSIFRRMNIDADAKIKFKEFFKFLKPLESDESFSNLLYPKFEGPKSQCHSRNSRRGNYKRQTQVSSVDGKNSYPGSMSATPARSTNTRISNRNKKPVGHSMVNSRANSRSRTFDKVQRDNGLIDVNLLEKKLDDIENNSLVLADKNLEGKSIEEANFKNVSLVSKTQQIVSKGR
jgi:hypothetical protein